MPPLTFLTVAPTAKWSATVIFCHGLGDSGAGWLPVAKMLAPQLPHVKWILPNSPIQRVSLAYGQEMPSWFDLTQLEKLTDPASEDVSGMESSMKQIQSLILQNSLDIDKHRTVIGGFSQGCALSLLSGLLDHDGKGKEIASAVGGIIALSGWLPMRATIHSRLQPNAKELPIFWGHGRADPVVNYQFGEASVKLLKGELGFPEATSVGGKGVDFKSYPGMGHSTSPEEIKHIGAWLSAVLPPK